MTSTQHLKFPLVAMLVLAIFPCLAADLPASKGKPVWQRSAPSTLQVTNQGVAIVSNHQYLVNSPHRCFPNKGETIAVSQTTIWRIAPVEGNAPSLQATAYRIMPDGRSAQLWSLKDHSDEGRLHCDYYETVWYGCCSSVPNHRLFNPKTGRLLMEYSERLITVDVPNSPLKRYIGYKPSETIQLNTWEKHPRHIGTLTYASPEGILQRVAIRGIGKFEQKFEMGLAKIQIRRGLPKQEMSGDTLRLWDVDGTQEAKHIGGFAVVLKYAGAVLELPVREDGFASVQRRFADYELVSVPEKAAKAPD